MNGFIEVKKGGLRSLIRFTDIQRVVEGPGGCVTIHYMDGRDKAIISVDDTYDYVQRELEEADPYRLRTGGAISFDRDKINGLLNNRS